MRPVFVGLFTFTLFFTWDRRVAGDTPVFFQRRLPLPHRDGRDGLNPTHHQRYPHYMMHLYRTLLLDISRPSGDFTHGHSSVNERLHNSDSILSLVAKRCSQTGSRWKITFDMSSISPTDIVQRSELRIRLTAFSESINTTVDIYHHSGGVCAGAKCQDQVLLASFRVAPRDRASRSSWWVLNITGLLQHWWHHRGSMENVDDGAAQADHQVPIYHTTTDTVMMVIFSKQEEGTGQRSSTLIHTAEQSKYVALDRLGAKQSSGGVGHRHKRNHPARGKVREAGLANAPEEAVLDPMSSLCRKVDMWVDFKQIGWGDWIVYPKRYNAFRCEGKCPNPVDESYAPTNHAYMQSLLRLHQPSRVPCPSCVAIHLGALPMLYFENGQMVMKNHESMVVEQCGCH